MLVKKARIVVALLAALTFAATPSRADDLSCVQEQIEKYTSLSTIQLVPIMREVIKLCAPDDARRSKLNQTLAVELQNNAALLREIRARFDAYTTDQISALPKFSGTVLDGLDAPSGRQLVAGTLKSIDKATQDALDLIASSGLRSWFRVSTQADVDRLVGRLGTLRANADGSFDIAAVRDLLSPAWQAATAGADIPQRLRQEINTVVDFFKSQRSEKVRQLFAMASQATAINADGLADKLGDFKRLIDDRAKDEARRVQQTLDDVKGLSKSLSDPVTGVANLLNNGLKHNHEAALKVLDAISRPQGPTPADVKSLVTSLLPRATQEKIQAVQNSFQELHRVTQSLTRSNLDQLGKAGAYVQGARAIMGALPALGVDRRAVEGVNSVLNIASQALPVIANIASGNVIGAALGVMGLFGGDGGGSDNQWIQEELQGVRNQLGEIQKAIHAIDGTLQRISHAIEGVIERLDVVDRKLDIVIKSQIMLSNQLDAISLKLDRMEENNQKRFEALSKVLEELGIKIDLVLTRLDQQEQNEWARCRTLASFDPIANFPNGQFYEPYFRECMNKILDLSVRDAHGQVAAYFRTPTPQFTPLFQTYRRLALFDTAQTPAQQEQTLQHAVAALSCLDHESEEFIRWLVPEGVEPPCKRAATKTTTAFAARFGTSGNFLGSSEGATIDPMRVFEVTKYTIALYRAAPFVEYGTRTVNQHTAISNLSSVVTAARNSASPIHDTEMRASVFRYLEDVSRLCISEQRLMGSPAVAGILYAPLIPPLGPNQQVGSMDMSDGPKQNPLSPARMAQLERDLKRLAQQDKAASVQALQRNPIVLQNVLRQRLSWGASDYEDALRDGTGQNFRTFMFETIALRGWVAVNRGTVARPVWIARFNAGSAGILETPFPPATFKGEMLEMPGAQVCEAALGYLAAEHAIYSAGDSSTELRLSPQEFRTISLFAASAAN